jgi:sortase A
MTATATLQRHPPPDDDPFAAQWPDASGSTTDALDAPPLSPRLQLIRAPIVMMLILSVTLLAQLSVVSAAQHTAAQQRAFDNFRAKLAKGTAPIGPTDADGHLLKIGTAVAYIEIPSIGVHEVVGEGTTPGVLFNGPGHRRDTPLPGQIGTSVLLGRRAAFGGPFADISGLSKGDTIAVTTGQGIFHYKVLGVRHEGDTNPAPPDTGSARVVLATAAGTPFLPDGVVFVDADLDGDAVVGPARLFGASSLPAEEKLMAGDTRTLWVLAFWLQAMIVLSVVGVWAWHRWGRARAWVVFLPPLLLVGLFVCGEAARLLPNLL